MADLDDLRRLALALPETEEGTHFRLVDFKVRGKGFAGLLPNGRAGVSVPAEQVPALVAEHAGLTELRRFDKVIGVELDLGEVEEGLLGRLVELAWRSRAPKRVVAAWEAGSR
ncbi:hypothetical protein GCM10023191_017680 [Actinoallomurus oryzae]|uniref:MmcQ/YjbR family DNA-binding protein n=1 Tax=Actinoallomurus oryzae TaxID=502180 RepID=A0ABP8PLA0_9ACTN